MIAVGGDNDDLHEEWLRKIVELIEGSPHGAVYRAWIEPVDYADPPEPPVTRLVR